MPADLFDSRSDFDAAVAVALKAAHAYYQQASLMMPDAQYDALIDQITATMTVHPDWDAGGLLDQVAAGTTSGGDVTHAAPMLSLTKATTDSEVAAFLTRIGNVPCVTEPKLDGLAISATYDHGTLTLVATRGDGVTGENVTAQARQIAGLPQQAPGFTGTVRGEVFMRDTSFDTSNAARVAAGHTAFKNPRNAVAGSLRRQESTYDVVMDFAVYDTFGPSVDDLPTYTDRLDVLEPLGFTTARQLTGLPATGDPADLIEQIGQIRPTLDFQIDGAVVKVDAYADRDRLGVGSRAPKYAIAWKYPAEETRSVLRSIDVTVGRTGRVAFTAQIDPVDVAGATVTYATLHNADFIAANRLGLGSDVLVSRANDVIPRVTGLDTDNNTTIDPWTPPTTCPQCGEPFDTSEVNWKCLSAECSLTGWITYFASRDVLDIDGLGHTVAEALVTANLVNDPADLYALTVEQFASLTLAEGRQLGHKNARKIVDSLTASKDQPLNRVITGLGIRMTGRSVSRWLAAEFGSMDALRAATVDQIAMIDKMGPVKAQSVVEGLAARADVIDRLAAAGLTMTAQTDQAGARPLDGQTVVVTGAMTGPLAGKTRTQMNELIEAAGGKASGSVSAKTSLLVCAEEGSSKHAKALSLGVPILTPEQFADLLSTTP